MQLVGRLPPRKGWGGRKQEEEEVMDVAAQKAQRKSKRISI
jgi:hypothetical protein